jgi:hypothetical protein
MAATDIIASLPEDSNFAEFERQIIEKHQQAAERGWSRKRWQAVLEQSPS